MAPKQYQTDIQESKALNHGEYKASNCPEIWVPLKLVLAAHKKGILSDISYLEVCVVRPWKVIAGREVGNWCFVQSTSSFFVCNISCVLFNYGKSNNDPVRFHPTPISLDWQLTWATDMDISPIRAKLAFMDVMGWGLKGNIYIQTETFSVQLFKMEEVVGSWMRRWLDWYENICQIIWDLWKQETMSNF